MSSSDEDDEMGGASFASIIAAGLADAAAAGVDVGEQGGYAMVQDAEEYEAATQQMIEFNNELAERSEVNQFLAKSDLTPAGHGFGGHVDEAAAAALYSTCVRYYDRKDECIKIVGETTKGGKKKQEDVFFKGFEAYAKHRERKKEENVIAREQRSSTAVVDGTFFIRKGMTGAQGMWPELFAVYEKLKTAIGTEAAYKIEMAHILFCKSKTVAFDHHQDKGELLGARGTKKDADLSVVMELSSSKSSMKIAEQAPLVYDKPGAFYAFDSLMWHRSGVAFADTVKIAFFFSKVKQLVLDESEEPEGTSFKLFKSLELS